MVSKIFDELHARAMEDLEPHAAILLVYPDGQCFNVSMNARDMFGEDADRRVWTPARRAIENLARERKS